MWWRRMMQERMRPVRCWGPVRSFTDAAAQAFVASFGRAGSSPCDKLVQSLRDAADNLTACTEAVVSVKVPEGFAFYSLLPEQYCLAATKWMNEHAAGHRPVLLVGVRSIGTTLSAVVRATLLQHRWKAGRITVRPFGDPFSAEVTLSFTPSKVLCVFISPLTRHSCWGNAAFAAPPQTH